MKLGRKRCNGVGKMRKGEIQEGWCVPDPLCEQPPHPLSLLEAVLVKQLAQIQGGPLWSRKLMEGQVNLNVLPLMKPLNLLHWIQRAGFQRSCTSRRWGRIGLFPWSHGSLTEGWNLLFNAWLSPECIVHQYIVHAQLLVCET